MILHHKAFEKLYVHAICVKSRALTGMLWAVLQLMCIQTEHFFFKLNEFIDLAIIAASVTCAMKRCVQRGLYMDEIYKTTILCLNVFFGNASNKNVIKSTNSFRRSH